MPFKTIALTHKYEQSAEVGSSVGLYHEAENSLADLPSSNNPQFYTDYSPLEKQDINQVDFGENGLDYVPLHLHSDYSIMDGLESVKAIVKQAVKLKLPALALTDLTNICGFIKFYSECKSNGIKPILGADLCIKDDVKPNETPFSFNITALAMDRVGKQNLYDLLSISWLNSDAGEFNAHISLEDLAKYNQGIILLDGFRGDLAHYHKEQMNNKIHERVQFYLKHFQDRFCLELTRTNREGETSFEKMALGLCMQYGIAPVATNDTRFLFGEQDIGSDGISDYQVHDVRVSIQAGIQRGSQQMAERYSKEQYLKSPEQMRILFHDLPEALYNTRIIAQRCNVDIELDHPRLPRYPTGDLTPAECLTQKSYEGLEERLEFLFPDEQVRAEKRPIYQARLQTELDVIIKMDFPGYFLIVMEFIQWSKDNDVPVGPGRGSGGGSLVAYALKITDFDPLQFDLLFERFLNPERVSMPDFDVDFCQRNREKTLTHVKNNYGLRAVSQIAAFGTMAPKAAIKDVGRALGMSYGATDYVAKMLPAQPGLSFKLALGFGKNGDPIDPLAPDFLEMYNNALKNDDKERIELVNYAMRLEGVIKTIGKHAAGVVISPTRTAEFAPLMLDSDGNPITQFDKKDVEHAGLVKFDFLGLTTLTIIQDAINMINEGNKRKGLPLVDIHDIPYEDEESFKVLQQGETTAVFQLESDGMRKLIGQMQPDRFDDLIALVALYRPGPIKSGMVDHFVKRKHGQEEVAYPSPDFQDLSLKPILDSTYGVIVYQEQVMQIAQVLASYSLGSADILRRAMGKKNPAEMAGQRAVFKDGAIQNGKDPEIAMKIFDQVEKFAEYGFNKSHSAAYALVAWWTLYLKVHYPAEFLAAMMTADRQRTEKLVSYIAECHRLNIKVNPPNVCVGQFDFTVDLDGSIIYGLGAIKGIGEELVAQIVKTRQEVGQFTDFFNFVEKVGTSRLNKKSLEALIYSGALDQLHPDRATMFVSIQLAITYANQKQAEAESGQMNLFSALDFEEESSSNTPEYVKCNPWSEKYVLHQEKQMLGLYLSGHPISAYTEELSRYCTTTLGHLNGAAYDRPVNETICGVVIESNERSSKKDGSKFYILTLDDSTSQIEIPLYGEQAIEYYQIISELKERHEQKLASFKDNIDPSETIASPLILVLNVTASNGQDNVMRIRVKRIDTFEQLRQKRAQNITVCFTKDFYEQHYVQINQILLRNALLVDNIRDRLRNYGLPPRKLNLNNDQDYNNQRKDNAYRASKNKEIFVDEGCRLSIMIDNVKLDFSNQYYRFSASDDLIEGIRTLAGFNAVKVFY